MLLLKLKNKTERLRSFYHYVFLRINSQSTLPSAAAALQDGRNQEDAFSIVRLLDGARFRSTSL